MQNTLNSNDTNPAGQPVPMANNTPENNAYDALTRLSTASILPSDGKMVHGIANTTTPNIIHDFTVAAPAPVAAAAAAIGPLNPAITTPAGAPAPDP